MLKYSSNGILQLFFETKPPPGYTFIPAGNPQLTNALKELADKEGAKPLAVSVGLQKTRFRSY